MVEDASKANITRMYDYYSNVRLLTRRMLSLNTLVQGPDIV